MSGAILVISSERLPPIIKVINLSPIYVLINVYFMAMVYISWISCALAVVVSKTDSILMSWMTSLGFYIKPVIIQLDLTPTNSQLTVKSSSRMTSYSLFLTQKDFLPANYQITIKSSSH